MKKKRIAQGWSGYIWTSIAWQLYHMGLCQSLQRRRKDQTMWQPKVLVEFHLKFKHCKILLKFSIQNIETTLWRQGVLYLHSYISCACVCVSEPVKYSFVDVCPNPTVLFCQKRSLWSIWVLHGFLCETLMVSLFVLILMNTTSSQTSSLFVFTIETHDCLRFSTRNGQGFLLSCRVGKVKNLIG